jgi:hypothetical protein
VSVVSLDQGPSPRAWGEPQPPRHEDTRRRTIPRRVRRRQFVLQRRCFVFIYVVASLVKTRVAQTCSSRSAAFPRPTGKTRTTEAVVRATSSLPGHLRPWFALPNSRRRRRRWRLRSSGNVQQRQFVLQQPCFVFIYLMASLVTKRVAQTCSSRSAALPCPHGKAADQRGGGPRYPSLIRSVNAATGGLDGPAMCSSDSSFCNSDALFSYI